MAPKDMGQGLLKRNPNLTFEQFSHHYRYNHAPIVVPFFLSLGISHYEQIHAPLSPTDISKFEKTGVKASEFDAAAASALPVPPEEWVKMTLEPWKQRYYDEVIKVDERRFLAGEALDIIVIVPADSVAGKKIVIIEDGKAAIDVPENVWETWREYEKSGQDLEGAAQ